MCRSCYNCCCVSLVVPCLFSFRLRSLLLLFPSVFRVLVLRLVLLRLLSLRCCLSFLLVFGCLWGALVALMGLSLLSLLVLLPCWCSPLPLVVLVRGVRLLPVGLLAACCLWLLVLAGCWWLCLLPLFALLVFVLHADKSFVVLSSVLALVLGVRWLLLSVAVVVCCCGCPLAVCLLLGLVCPGLPLVRLVRLALGGSVLPFPFPRSCLCFSSLPSLLSLSQRRSLDDKLLANL
jgi:hypothetical protein